MAKLFSIDFEVVPQDKAVVSVMDRGFLYGDSVYEVVRTYRKTIPFLLDRHHARMLRSAERIGLVIPFSLEKIERHVRECVERANNADSYVRIIVSRGEDIRFDLMPGDHLKPRTIVLVDHVPLFPSSFFDDGIPIALVSVRRNLRTALDPNIKSGNYLNNMLAMIEAKKSGAADAVMFNHEDCVTEGTTSNVFIVKDGVVITPEVKSGLLEGISRALLKDLMLREKIRFEERAISRDEFMSADEVFLSGTIKELMPVNRVGERKVGSGKPGPVTRNLMGLFRKEVDKILDQHA